MRLPQTTTKKARIEIIPMIDAIFFLLVFFMFSSLSMVKMNGLPVALPKAPPAVTPAGVSGKSATAQKGATPAGKPRAPRRMILAIQPGTGTRIDGVDIGDSDRLVQALTTRLSADPDAVVVVRAAKGVTAQRLIGVMDALNRVSLPGGKRPQVVVGTVASPPTGRTNVLPVSRNKGDATPNVQ